jgi:hypothetical protein
VAGASIPTEVAAPQCRNDALAPAEWCAEVRLEEASAMELNGYVSRRSIIPIERSQLSEVNQTADLEHAANAAVRSGTVSEFAGGVINGSALGAEELFSVASNTTLSLAALAACRRDTLVALDPLSTGISLFASEILLLEWLDPPNLMEISIGRLLRSSGRIRILAGGISNSPTKGR